MSNRNYITEIRDLAGGGSIHGYEIAKIEDNKDRINSSLPVVREETVWDKSENE